ncbi:aldo/keto reductase [Streptomyces catenulae]|uniref:Aldo/keto reductase n=1 Tax=Streptomyces catenulae TaxID=66875 RepID=A0ABV2Z2G4_9ACTN|nr:aldo/keto reductase [Streptomyces catenulae]
MTATPPGGTLHLAGKTVSRLGLGTMRLTGPGTWGYPDDCAGAVHLLRHAVHTHGITHLDTADAYGPHTVEHLIREALFPYPESVLIATKVGMLRTGPNLWTPHGHPAYLCACVEASLRRLGVDQLDLCYLHRIDPNIPLADQVGVLRALQDEGKIAHIGLSKVTPEQIKSVGRDIEIAAVQNALNINERHDPALDLCRDLKIPYVPYRPLNAGTLAPNAYLGAALRWLLDLGPHVAPIPGTSSRTHLTELVNSLAEEPLAPTEGAPE